MFLEVRRRAVLSRAELCPPVGDRSDADGRPLLERADDLVLCPGPASDVERRRGDAVVCARTHACSDGDC